MTEHVGAWVADYVQGRLDPARAREVEEHLTSCPECTADFAWARSFRDAAVASGLSHPAPERILELTDGTGEPPSAVESEHVKACAACAEEVAWLRGLPGSGDLPASDREAGLEVGGPPRRPSAVRGRFRLHRWGLAGLAGAGAAAVLAVFVMIPGKRPAVSDLARIEPLPVRITRGPLEPGSFEARRMLGLERYAEADYAGARESLRSASSQEPEHAEVLLYLGSAELLLGNVPEGAEILGRAAEHADDPAILEEALWQLANAELARSRIPEAERALRQVVAAGGRRGERAGALLARLETDR